MDVNEINRRRALDRQALAWSAQVVASVRDADLDNATPCGDWTLRELLGHMIAHHHGFAAACAGVPVGGEVWDRLSYDGDLQDAYPRAAAAVSAAFDSPDLPEKIEVYGYGAVPAQTVLGMHIVDFVVHGWDVARAIGSNAAPDEQLTADAFAIMRRFPTDRPNQAFDVMVPVSEDAPVADQLMGYVGRDPAWGLQSDRRS
jgi:uncharacterized protein (TIGR03086 family)